MTKIWKSSDMNCLDFETAKIEDGRHRYPPKPAGLSVRLKGQKTTKYYAFGHPTENNCSKAEVMTLLKRIWADAKRGIPILCQNTKFDYDVACEHFGLGDLPWDMMHDTLYLLFMDNPHAKSHSLKPSGERLLGIPPTEQEAVRDWLIEHQGQLRSDGLLPENEKITKSSFGAYISLAPGKLVGKYADQDVNLTCKLFDLLYRDVCIDREMLEAYDRERELMPILLQNEREGVQFDLDRANTDIVLLEKSADYVDVWLRKKLKCKDLNIDSDPALAEALMASGCADPDLFKLTKKGKISVAKDSLINAVTNKEVLATLQYRAKLHTFLGTFLEPWADEAAHDPYGYVHPSWNQVKQYGSFGDAGARTGRMSASRFMNTPKEVTKYVLPTWIKGVEALPFVRDYLLPDEGTLWGKRDYMQQEFRVLAHYENGALLKAFCENPELDVHILVASLLNGIDASKVTDAQRSIAKNNGFGLLYGMGIGKLADRLGVDVEKATELKKGYLEILPGLKTLMKRLNVMGRNGLPFYTWGGREYYCEEPRVTIDESGRAKKQTYEYKMINYLIQGSSADCTKQAIINYHNSMKADSKCMARFLITVHDEINFCAKPKAMPAEMERLNKAMLSVKFDVPMLSDGAVGATWGSIKKVKG